MPILFLGECVTMYICTYVQYVFLETKCFFFGYLIVKAHVYVQYLISHIAHAGLDGLVVIHI
jgi:hypothetical protein